MAAAVERDPGPLHAAQQRLQHVPQRGPAEPGGTAERCRMVGPNRRRERVVVEGHQLRAPEQADLRARRQHQAQRRLQAVGPCLREPERRARPVGVTQPRAAVAAVREERRAPEVVEGSVHRDPVRLWRVPHPDPSPVHAEADAIKHAFPLPNHYVSAATVRQDQPVRRFAGRTVVSPERQGLGRRSAHGVCRVLPPSSVRTRKGQTPCAGSPSWARARSAR